MRAFGVEIEGILYNKKPSFLKDLLNDNDIPTYNRFEVYYEAVAPYSYWELGTDNSIELEGPGGKTPEWASQVNSFELRSPILTSLTPLRNVLKIILPFIEFNETCGFHVHVDGRDFSRDEVMNLLAWYSRYEHVFATLVAPHRLTNNYCSLWRHDDDFVTMNIFRSKDMTFYTSKYLSLNIVPYVDLKFLSENFEFRLFEGTRDLYKLCKWVELVTNFVDFVKKAPWTRICTVKDMKHIVTKFNMDSHFRSKDLQNFLKICGQKPKFSIQNYFSKQRDPFPIFEFPKVEINYFDSKQQPVVITPVGEMQLDLVGESREVGVFIQPYSSWTTTMVSVNVDPESRILVGQGSSDNYVSGNTPDNVNISPSQIVNRELCYGSQSI